MTFIFWGSLLLTATGFVYWNKWENQFVAGAFRFMSSLPGPHTPTFDRRPAVGAMIFGVSGAILSGLAITGPNVATWWTPELTSFLNNCFLWGSPFLLIGFLIGIYSR